MDFRLTGSSGKWWGKFTKNFNEDQSFFGKFKRVITDNLSNNRNYISAKRGGFLGEAFHKENSTSRLSKGLANLDRTTMGWSRQASPLWEGGLTRPGGTTQDILDMGKHWNMAGGHMLFGNDYYSNDDGGSRTSSSASDNVAISDTEDPSLINQGNWQRPGEIESHLRREQEMNRGVLAHDLTKNQRGRQTVATV